MLDYKIETENFVFLTKHVLHVMGDNLLCDSSTTFDFHFLIIACFWVTNLDVFWIE